MYSILFFLAATSFFNLAHAQKNQGIMLIIDTADTLMSPHDPMIDRLKHALTFRFPIIVSWKIFSYFEIYAVERTFEDAYPAWAVRHQGDLALLIPLEQGMQQKLLAPTSEDTPSQVITDLEIQLGLKVDHPYDSEKPGFTELLSKIFVTQAELKQYNQKTGKNAQAISWSLCMRGHGSKDTSIAGLGLEEFRNFLDFLKSGISTQFLLYSTCYGGGCNRVNGFKDGTGADKIYDFPIVVIGSLETATHSTNVNEDILFEGLFKKYEPGSYYKLLRRAGFFTINELDTNELDPYNIPQLRAPGTAKFTILEPEINEWVFISDKTFLENNEFKIPGMTRALIIDRSDVPYDLVIRNFRRLSQFIFYDQQSQYAFRTILSDIPDLKKFLKLLFLEGQKSLYTITIKKLILAKSTYTDLTVTIQPDKITVQGSTKNNYFKKEFSYHPMGLQEILPDPVTRLNDMFLVFKKFVNNLYRLINDKS